VIFAVALALTVGFVWGIGQRHEYKDATILLTAVWVMTNVAQILTGDFEPYPLNAAIDMVAAYIVYRSTHYRWQVFLLATFAFDLVLHPIRFSGGLGTMAYLTALTFVAYVQLLIVGGVAWHEKRGFGVGVGVFGWLRADTALARRRSGVE